MLIVSWTLDKTLGCSELRFTFSPVLFLRLCMELVLDVTVLPVYTPTPLLMELDAAIQFYSFSLFLNWIKFEEV